MTGNESPIYSKPAPPVAPTMTRGSRTNSASNYDRHPPADIMGSQDTSATTNDNTSDNKSANTMPTKLICPRWPTRSIRTIQMTKMPKMTQTTPSTNRLKTTAVLLVAVTVIGLHQRCDAATPKLGAATPANITEPEGQSLKLNCTPGETRLFKYDSLTRFWGNSTQRINLSADIRVHCMEVNDKSMTIKYFVEILNLAPRMVIGTGSANESLVPARGDTPRPARRANRANKATTSIGGVPYGADPVESSVQFRHLSSSHHSYPSDEGVDEEEPRVEPLLEELGEMSVRMRRSVTGWFTNTWMSVRDFFGKLFNSADGPHGLRDNPDSLFGQCKASGDAGQPGGGMWVGPAPFDESVFEEPESKITMGASTEGSSEGEARSAGTDGDNPDNQVSFFDRPKVVPLRARLKRATAQSGGPSLEPDTLFRLPFEFLQSPQGRIVEVRFSVRDTDVSIKNFKRHICDLFATQLDRSQPSQSELTPVGRHVTRYLYDDGDGQVLKQSLGGAPGDGAHSDGPLYTRVLAVVGGTGASKPVGTDDESGADTGPKRSGADEGRVSIIRAINSTEALHFGAQAIVHDVSQVRIQVKQVQQIHAHQMVSTAGRLSMSLVRGRRGGDGAPINADPLVASNRLKRSPAATPRISIGVGLDDADLDMAHLLHVSTSFSMELASQLIERPARNAGSHTDNPGGRLRKRDTSSSEQLKQLESELKMVSTSMMAEPGGPKDGQLQRLELLRDQVMLRLNEEMVLAKNRKQQQQQQQPYDLGLGLTQIILDSGRTSKRRGSLYATLEEMLDLELATKQDTQPESMSRLLRDTVRSTQLHQHCMGALHSGQPPQSRAATTGARDSRQTPAAAAAADPLGRNQRKAVDQCKQILQLLLRVNGREAIQLTLDLIDACNNQLRQGWRHEETGHGPGSRYYRAMRQQFIELLTSIGQPSDQLLDKLMGRLHYPLLQAGQKRPASSTASASAGPVQPERGGLEYTFALRPASAGSAKAVAAGPADDTNNHDGDGSMVISITNLATKSSVSPGKRTEIATRLLNVLRNTTCSLAEGPDLDILEAMGNFNAPIHEIVPKIVHLARKCRHQDQYIVACVHASQGQLENGLIQRWLTDLLRSANVTCQVKSEIVATLNTVASISQLMASAARGPNSATGGQTGSETGHSQGPWPLYGLNQLDQALLDLVTRSEARTSRCLRKYVEDYIGAKRLSEWARADSMRKLAGSGSGSDSLASAATSTRSAVWSRAAQVEAHRRYRRFIAKDFWDEASCKRWSYGPQDQADSLGDAFGSGSRSGSGSGSDSDSGDDSNGRPSDNNNNDNSIVASLAPSSRKPAASSRSRRKNGLLLEREESAERVTSLGPNSSLALVNRRQKCTATKTYGPRNAEATIKAEIVNDVAGPNDDSKFLARFTIASNFLGSKVDIGRMYMWHQRQTTRAYVNMFGKTLWDTSHSCHDKTPHHIMYMPLFDFNIWVVKINVGIRLHSEMGFYSLCRREHSETPNNPDKPDKPENPDNFNNSDHSHNSDNLNSLDTPDQLELFPTISVRASGEASAKFVVARAGMSVGSHYSYRGQIRVSRKPQSCMSIMSGHEPMNVTFSSWYQLWDNDCHYWGSRVKGEPHAIKWSLNKRRSTTWVSNECLAPASNRSLVAKIEP